MNKLFRLMAGLSLLAGPVSSRAMEWDEVQKFRIPASNNTGLIDRGLRFDKHIPSPLLPKETITASLYLPFTVKKREASSRWEALEAPCDERIEAQDVKLNEVDVRLGELEVQLADLRVLVPNKKQSERKKFHIPGWFKSAAELCMVGVAAGMLSFALTPAPRWDSDKDMYPALSAWSAMSLLAMYKDRKATEKLDLLELKLADKRKNLPHRDHASLADKAAGKHTGTS